jgi:UDP-glucose 4-epimerase
MMNILVTGGTGYIGGTVTRLLLSAKHSVTIYDNLCHSRRSAAAEGAEFVEGELADRSLLEKTLQAGRFDGVMHFAALIEAGESMQKPEIYFRNNTGSDACHRPQSAGLQLDRGVLWRTQKCSDS